MLPHEISDFAREAVEPIRARKQRRAAEDELLDHLETVYEQNLATGMKEKEAAENAVARMGKLETLQARYADLYGGVEPRPMHVTMDCLGLGLLLSHLCLFVSPNTDLLFQVAGGLLVLFSMLRLRTVSQKARKIFFLQPAALFLQIFAFCATMYFGILTVPAAVTHIAAWVADGIFICALYTVLCEVYNAAYEPGDPLIPGIFPSLFLFLGCEYAFPHGSTNRRVYVAATRTFMGGDAWGSLVATEGLYFSQRFPLNGNGLGLAEHASNYLMRRYSTSSKFIQQRQFDGVTQAPIDPEHYTEKQEPVFG